MSDTISEYDKTHIEDILSGREGDWFAADLLRLIAKADHHNRERLRVAFPEVVEAFEKWKAGE